MIPLEHRTKEGERLQSIIDGYQGDLTKLKPIKDNDIKLIGHFIHTYSFIEINLRRSVQTFAIAGLLGNIKPKVYQRYDPAKLISSVKAGLTGTSMNPAEIADAIGKLDEIEARWRFRNMLAHFAASRIPKEEAIVFLSLDSRDLAQIYGDTSTTTDEDPHFMLTACVSITDLRGLGHHMIPYRQWIARKANDWSKELKPCA